jgi:hypothetical protein
LIAAAVLTLVAGGAFGKDQVGNEVLTFEFDNPPWYNHCVREIVNGHVIGEIRYHEFETPSGSFHIVDQWRFKVYATGTISGRVWVGSAVSPLEMNTKLEKGQVQQWVSNIRFIALGEKAPAYFYQDDFKITVNANGELVVLHEEDLVGANYRCLGPKE